MVSGNGPFPIRIPRYQHTIHAFITFRSLPLSMSRKSLTRNNDSRPSYQKSLSSILQQSHLITQPSQPYLSRSDSTPGIRQLLQISKVTMSCKEIALKRVSTSCPSFRKPWEECVRHSFGGILSLRHCALWPFFNATVRFFSLGQRLRGCARSTGYLPVTREWDDDKCLTNIVDTEHLTSRGERQWR